MKKMKDNRNTRILVENNGNKDGFNIFLDFSGQREFLMYHRHNGRLFTMLKDGMVVDDARRWKPSKKHVLCGGRNGSAELYDTVNYLISVIDDYLLERQAC